LFDLQSLIWLLAITLVAGFCWQTYQVKPYAVLAVKSKCQQLGLQLLDQSVALKSIRIKRGNNGWPNLMRCYVFEFSSTGDERYYGKIWLRGIVTESIDLAAHRLPSSGTDG